MSEYYNIARRSSSCYGVGLFIDALDLLHKVPNARSLLLYILTLLPGSAHIERVFSRANLGFSRNRSSLEKVSTQIAGTRLYSDHYRSQADTRRVENEEGS